MKVKGYLRDLGEATKIEKWRASSASSASKDLDSSDSIGQVAHRLHPGGIQLVVKGVRDTSKNSKAILFAAKEGNMPIVQAGQYLALSMKIGESVISRPYTISSSPFWSLSGGVEITVKKTKGGFAGNWLYDNVKIGDEFFGCVGLGQFTYEPLRDGKHILAIAGGSGITPFLAMAKGIKDEMIDADMTILYGSVSEDDIIAKEDLDELSCPRVKVVYVLSGNNPHWKGEKGYVDSLLIARYLRKDSSIFICGPEAMQRYVDEELTKLNIPERRIRHELLGTPKDVTRLEGYPKGREGEVFTLTVKRGIHEDRIPARADEPLAVAIERAGIRIPTDCRSGACGFCRSKVLSGEVFVSPLCDGRRGTDKEFGYYHLCVTYPLSDVTVKINIA